MLASAPQTPSDSKIQAIENYSSVVDLRSNPMPRVSYTETWYNAQRGTKNWQTDARVLIQNAVSGVSGTVDFSANNGSVVTFDANVDSFKDFSPGDGYNRGIYLGSPGHLTFRGNGTFVFNFGGPADVVTSAGSDVLYQGALFSFFDTRMGSLNITSKFIATATGKIGSFLTIGMGAEYAYGNGKYYIRSPYIKINMKTAENSGTGQYVIYNKAKTAGGNASHPDFFINAKDDGSINDSASIQQYDGNFFFNDGRLFMHLTNADSYIHGNLELDNLSSVVSFSNNATMEGDIKFSNGNRGDYSVTFDNSSLTGNITVLGSGNNSIVFNNSDFQGVVRGGQNYVNTTISFENTDGHTFGSSSTSEYSGVIYSDYYGVLTGSFDVSASSKTVIIGGSDGSKGFLGKGTNTLSFDFKGTPKSNVAANNRFTISNGNAQSLYVMNNFSDINFSDLNATNSLYSKLQDAGINIQAEANGQNNGHLNGTLFFHKTNMNVGEGEQALFAKTENIVGTNKALNGLAIGAMFGNATWIDANKDGSIAQDEITANGGVTYKLTSNSSSSNSSNSVDEKTSIVNIGSINDNINKHVAFIFANGTKEEGYVFNGDKQGYSGTIQGGTADK